MATIRPSEYNDNNIIPVNTTIHSNTLNQAPLFQLNIESKIPMTWNNSIGIGVGSRPKSAFHLKFQSVIIQCWRDNPW